MCSLKEVVLRPFFYSTAKVFTFSTRTLIVLHNDFFPGSTFSFEFADDTLELRERKRYMRVSELAWRKGKRQNDKEKRRATTTTKKPNWNEFVFVFVFDLSVFSRLFFFSFFAFIILKLVCLYVLSRMDIPILGILYVIFFYNKSLWVRMVFLFYSYAFAFYSRIFWL